MRSTKAASLPGEHDGDVDCRFDDDGLEFLDFQRLAT
jgi:hypothetical protein